MQKLVIRTAITQWNKKEVGQRKEKEGNGKVAEKNRFRTTYSVTIAYLTDEIYERLRHVDSKLGRGFDETTSELLRDKLALCRVCAVACAKESSQKCQVKNPE